MSEQEARALAADIERTPGWLAEVFEGATGGRWYIVAGRTADPLTHFILRSVRDWERLCELLRDDA
jgi:hypothetical protein